MNQAQDYQPRHCNVLLVIYDEASLLERLADERRCWHNYSRPTPKVSREQAEELVRLLRQDATSRSPRQRRHGRNLVQV